MTVQASGLPAILLATQATLQALGPRADDQGNPMLDNNGKELLLFEGVALGANDSVPNGPWAILQHQQFTAPQLEGSEREITDWNLQLRVLIPITDHYVAELMLARCIEGVREGFRRHIKQGLPSIERTRVTAGDALYVIINKITYRAIDLTIMVREKVTVSFAA